jgi:hypothetical protein
MSDCSPILRRRRSHIVPGTPTSQISPEKVKKKFKIRTTLTQSPNSSSSFVRIQKRRKEKKKVMRRENRRCKLIEHQAKDSEDSEENSSDLDDSSNDSCVTSNSDASDGSYAGYALGMSSQAEAAGFTVPLHLTRFSDRVSVADMILQRRDEKIRSGRIASSAQLTSFEQYAVRVRDGVGVPILLEPKDPPELDLPMLFGQCNVEILPPAQTSLEVIHTTPLAGGMRAPYSIFVVPSGRVRVPGRLQLPQKPTTKAAFTCDASLPFSDIPQMTCDATSSGVTIPPFESEKPDNLALAQVAITCDAPSPVCDIPHPECDIPQVTCDANSLVVTLPPVDCENPDNLAVNASSPFKIHANSSLVCDQAVQTSPVKETPLTREGLRDELQALLLSLGL